MLPGYIVPWDLHGGGGDVASKAPPNSWIPSDNVWVIICIPHNHARAHPSSTLFHTLEQKENQEQGVGRGHWCGAPLPRPRLPTAVAALCAVRPCALPPPRPRRQPSLPPIYLKSCGTGTVVVTNDTDDGNRMEWRMSHNQIILTIIHTTTSHYYWNAVV